MGRLKSTADLPELTEEKIQEYLHLRHPLLTSPRYEAFNMCLYGWESDYLAFSKAGYIWEAEIKISRKDFLKDIKNKTEKHQFLRLAMKGESPVPVPNHFVYVCPEGIIRPEDIEDLPYGGLLWVYGDGWFRWQTGVPDIHKAKHPFDDATLAEKFHYAMLNMAKRYWKKGVVDISGATRAAYEKTIMDYDDMLSERTNEIDELNSRIRKLESILTAANIDIPEGL